MSSFRELTDKEKQLLEKLMTVDFVGKNEINRQISNCLVRTIDKEGSLEFYVKTDIMANVEMRIPIEGEIEDEDGILIHVLLHVVQGKIDELEIYKEDGSEIIKMPDPSKMELIQLGN